MARPDFTHLHVHTEYNILDGIAGITELTAAAQEQEATALAITDHGNLYGGIDFYWQCRERGIKPIIGCEAYVALESRHSKTPTERSPQHLTLLAQDNTGYADLVELITRGHHEGFYQKPRVDRELLAAHSDGLICLSGCPAGELPHLLGSIESSESEIGAVIEWYRAVFPDRYFLEIQ